MKNMLWMGAGVGVGYLVTRYKKPIMKSVDKAKNQIKENTTKKSS